MSLWELAWVPVKDDQSVAVMAVVLVESMADLLDTTKAVHLAGYWVDLTAGWKDVR